MTDERLQILKMVEEGKLSADEAIKLLDALDSRPAPKPKHLKIRVAETGGKTHNISLSVDMIERLATGLAQVQIGGEPLNLTQLRSAVAEGRNGKVLDLQEEGRRVEVWLE